MLDLAKKVVGFPVDGLHQSPLPPAYITGRVKESKSRNAQCLLRKQTNKKYEKGNHKSMS